MDTKKLYQLPRAEPEPEPVNRKQRRAQRARNGGGDELLKPKSQLHLADGSQSLKGRENVYICTECRHCLVTQYEDHGTAPFMMKCTCCGGMAQSTGHRLQTRMTPELFWYRPTGTEYEALLPGLRAHVDRGGVIYKSNPLFAIEMSERAAAAEKRAEEEKPH